MNRKNRYGKQFILNEEEAESRKYVESGIGNLPPLTTTVLEKIVINLLPTMTPTLGTRNIYR